MGLRETREKVMPEQMQAYFMKALEDALAPMKVRMDALETENQAFRQVQSATKLIESILRGTDGGDIATRIAGLPINRMPVYSSKGLGAAGMLRAYAAGKGNPDRAAAWSKKMYGEDHQVTRALMASDFDAGGSLVKPEFAAEIIELLRPRSVVRSMNPRTIPLVNGTMTWPKVTGASQAFYAGEGQNLRTTQPSTGDMQLTGKKLGAIVPISSDLIRVASVAADEWVRDELIATANLRSDLAFIRGDGTLETPRGMRYWAAPANIIAGNTASQNTTPTLVQIVSVLGDLWQRLADADVRFLQPGWLMSPRTARVLMDTKTTTGQFVFRDEMTSGGMGNGTLNGAPYRITTQIPQNLTSSATELYFADFADLIIGEEETMELSISTEASYTDGDGNTQSAFQRDQTLVKVVMIHDFGSRHDVSIAVQTDLRWATGP